jgi:hypothetical protein
MPLRLPVFGRGIRVKPDNCDALKLLYGDRGHWEGPGLFGRRNAAAHNLCEKQPPCRLWTVIAAMESSAHRRGLKSGIALWSLL